MEKLLCLHGYTQNGPLFSKRLGALRKQLLKSNIECHFPTGLHKPTTSFNPTNPEEDERCWWNSVNNHTVYDGLEESVEQLQKYMNENGPFKGILGFSQGSVMAAVMASIVKPDYVVIVSGFMPRAKNALDLLTFSGPSLHVIGSRDELVLPENSRSLADYLGKMDGKVEFLEHDGGHFVPGKSEYRNELVQWITSHSLLKQKL